MPSYIGSRNPNRYITSRKRDIWWFAALGNISGGTVSATFTADAILRRTQSASFTADAVIVGGTGGSITADAVLRATLAASLTADAIVRVGQSASFTADAVIASETTVSASLTADAVLRKTQSASLMANAVLRATRTASLTSNAVVRRTQAGSFTADAVFAKWFTANAVIRRTQTHSFTASAWIYAPRADPDGQGEPGETPLVSIIVGGIDITQYVVLSDATFTMLVNGAIGSFSFRVRDDDHSMTFISGAEVTVDIDGKRRFGGYLMQPKRLLAFPVVDTADPEAPSRFHTLVGVDYNILLTRRIVYDHSDPTRMELRKWPAGSDADVVIKYVFDHYTDLGADGVTYNGVTNVGSPNPDKAGIIGSGSLSFGDLLKEVNRLISGVFYIDPYKDLNYVDVDTPNAPKGLSDNPGPGQIGYREFSHTENGAGLVNDAMVWGAGLGMKTDVLTFSRVEDAASIAAHGLWQFGEYTTALFRQASVDMRADTIVNGTAQGKRGGKDPQESWRCITFDTSFELGHKVDIESEVFNISDVVPIRRMTMTFAPGKRPKFDLTLSHEIDEPWNLFEFWFPKFPPFDPGNFDLSFDGHLPDPGGCECGITDSFSRTYIASYPEAGWGRSDSGLAWGSGIANSTPITGYVDGGVGVLDMSIDTVPLGYVYLDWTASPTLDALFSNVTWSFDGFQVSAYRQAKIEIDFDYYDVAFQLWVNEDRFTGDGHSVYIDGTYHLYPGLFNAPFNIRVHAEGTTASLNIWPASEAEPVGWAHTWTTSGYFPGSGNGLFIRNQITDSQGDGGHSVFTLDALNINGVTACEAVQFDDFNRSVANGWGNATPSGYMWGIGTGGVGNSASVDGSSGLLNTGTSGNTAHTLAYISGGLPSGLDGDYEMTSTFSFLNNGAGITAGNFLRVMFGLSDNGNWGSNSSGEFFRERGVQIWYPPGSVNFQLGVTTDPGSEDGNTPATFVFADSGITVGFDFALNVRLQVTGTTIRAKLWRTDTPEPSAWTVEETMTADIGPVSDFIVELNRHGTPATANIAGFDSIDFDYDGKPCFPCTVNSETTSFETFDDFNRTVAPSSWGTASSGPTYSYIGNNPTFVPLSVNGSEGKMYLDGNTFPDVFFGPSAGNTSNPVDPGPWNKDQFVFKCKFKTPNYTYGGLGGSDGYYIFRLGTHGRHIFIAPGSDSPFSDPNGFIENDDGGHASFDFHPETWYYIKWYYNYLNGDSWLKVWDVDDPEPDWIVTNSTYSGGPSGDDRARWFEVDVWNLPFGISSNPATVYWDDFQFGVCEASSAGSGGASGGGGRTDQTGNGTSTVFLTSNAYEPGSTRVFVGGYLQRPGFEYTESDPTIGEITFTSPPANGSSITIFYQVVSV